MSSRFLSVTFLMLAACSREMRELRPSPGRLAVFADAARESSLIPGGSQPAVSANNPYQDNAFAISEGQRLYNWYNCSGCHANGGGGIGPPLMKDQWIYGSEPANIFDTIVKGRPNGMPSWGGKIPEYQIWQLVAYVRSMNQLESKAATPPRQDTLPLNPGNPPSGAGK